MNNLTKDEILAMAREAGAVFDPQWGIASNIGTATFERFATLCRAPLIAENEGLKESLESVLSQLKERDAELARVRAGEPFGWYSAKEDDFMLDKIRKTHERLNSHTHRIGKYDTALFTAPQPAAQEPDCATTGVCVRSGLYASPPGAVPVVEPDMFWNHDDAEKLYHGIGEFLNDEICNGSLAVGDIRVVQQAKRLPNVTIRVTSINDEECDAEWEVIDAIAAGQKFIKENGK